MRRGAAALGSELAAPEEAVRNARAQLVEGIDDMDEVQAPAVAARIPTAGEQAEWVGAFKAANVRTRADTAPGPTGLPPGFLKRLLMSEPEAVALLAKLMPTLLASPPEFLIRSRLASIAKVKADGSRKVRAIACGEALMRLVERAVLARWGPAMLAAAPGSAAHLRDGALLTGAVCQLYAARGRAVVSMDAKRAYDSVSHAAIEEALREAGLPDELVGFILRCLQQRQYAIAGERILPPRGRGIPQGTALGPVLFALVAQRAVRAVERAAPGIHAVTYLDNLYLADSEGWGQEALEAAVKAAREQWARDGLVVGDAWTLNCQIPGIPAADDRARVLGVAPHGAALERYERARKLARAAGQMCGLAELIVLRESAANQVVYDQRAGAAEHELKELETELAAQVARRAGIPDTLRGVVHLPAAQRGLGLRPLAQTRKAAVLHAGLAALTGKQSVLSGAVFSGVAHPAGDFFKMLAATLADTGYEVDVVERTVKQGGALVVRPPSTLMQAARRIEAVEVVEAIAPARTADDGSDHARSATAKLLCGAGARPQLTEEEYQAAVRLHCGLNEPPAAGVRAGDMCPLCRGEVRAGHHRWCGGLALAMSLQHHSLRDATAEWLGQADAIHVQTEVASSFGGAAAVRADVVVSAPETDGRVLLEVKSIDLRCASHARTTVAAEDARLEEIVKEHYHGAAMPMIMTQVGAHGRGTAETIARLQALRAHSAAHLADGPTLMVMLGRACARAEAHSFADWRDAVAGVEAARALAAPRDREEARGGGGAEARGEAENNLSNSCVFAVGGLAHGGEMGSGRGGGAGRQRYGRSDAYSGWGQGTGAGWWGGERGGSAR